MHENHEPPVYGLMAAFAAPEALVAAVRKVRAAGYTQLDAYSPFPIEGLAEELGARTTRLPWFVLFAGIAGAICGYGLQYYCSVVAYPLNVGGRPLHSWPAFVPVTFELTILFAALAAVLGMLIFNRLPMPYHPVFNVSDFSLASRDRFFLTIESTDALFDVNETAQLLQQVDAIHVRQVDP